MMTNASIGTSRVVSSVTLNLSVEDAAALRLLTGFKDSASESTVDHYGCKASRITGSMKNIRNAFNGAGFGRSEAKTHL